MYYIQQFYFKGEQGISSRAELASVFLTATMLKFYLCGTLHLHGPICLCMGPFRFRVSLSTFTTEPFHQREPPVEGSGVVCPDSARDQDTQTRSFAPVTLIST